MSILCSQLTIKIFGYASPSKSVYLSKLKSKIKIKHPHLTEIIKEEYYFCGSKEEHTIRKTNRERRETKVRSDQTQFTTTEVKTLIEHFTSSECPWQILMGLAIATGSRKCELLCASEFYNYGDTKEGTFIAMSNHIKDTKFKDPLADMSQTEIERRRKLPLKEQTKLAIKEKRIGIKNPELVKKPLLFLTYLKFEGLLKDCRKKIKKELKRELSIFPRRCISAEASHKIFAMITMQKHMASPEFRKTLNKVESFHYCRALYGSCAHVLFNPTCAKTLYLKSILGHQSETVSAIYDKCCVTVDTPPEDNDIVMMMDNV